MNHLKKQPLRGKNFPSPTILVLCLLVMLLLITKQSSARYRHTVPAAGSRAARVDYYFIDCPGDSSQEMHRVVPLPQTRYLYSDTYGWFDTAHFDTGDPAKLITNLEAAAKKGGDSVISISQAVRGGVTGYTGYYLISGKVSSDEVPGVALGVYQDWSIRFEAWQGQLPRSLVGPFTPFSIEDLPTQYLGFVDETSSLSLEAIFACYLGEVESAEPPPHLWIADENPDDELNLPAIDRLVNQGFQPMVLTKKGWRLIRWPIPLRLEPVASSKHTWGFIGEETWYLGQDGGDW